MTELYRIDKILEARMSSGSSTAITFIYPFWDDNYKSLQLSRFIPGDVDLGRLGKEDMYDILVKTRLTISIPISDSSPRSVYEAIFAGSCVAATYAPWIDALPESMKCRIIVVDINDDTWFSKAINYADEIIRIPFRPCSLAMNLFDQRTSMQKLIANVYDGLVT